MTGTYDWNPMPHRVSVRCPSCAGLATFEFAEIVRIRRRTDVAWFEKSRLLEYVFVREPHAGQSWHGAVFYAGLLGGSTAVLRDLPDGYSPADWSHSRWFVRRLTDRGSVTCVGCGLRRKHRLSWPDDAWFRIDYRGSSLWAFDRDSASALRDFVASTERKRVRRRRWASFLLHVPSRFLVRSARATILKRLDVLLLAAIVGAVSV